jgi:aldose sugar dehydrogenase
MKKLILILMLCITYAAFPQTEPFTKRTITVSGGMNRPWEIVYGPNDSLWISESAGYTIYRISQSGTKTLLLNLSAANDDWASGTGPQGGLMGMVLHPNLYSSDPAVRSAKPWVYIAYVYAKASPNTTCAQPGGASGCVFSTRIERYEYRNNALINPVTILNALPGSSDHNSGRLAMSRVIEPGSDAPHTQYRLYYSIGDMGAGQFANTNRTNNAQTQNSFEGKILRINTEVDGDAGADAWVPNDNPFFNASTITAQDYVYSMGHRNPQGLVWGDVFGNRRLYSSEQSDRADDEINVISAGGNFGWDKVSGRCDNDVNGFKIGQQTIVNEMTNCAGTIQPIFTTFHNNATWPSTYPADGSSNANWPTTATSSIEFYGKHVIPNWPNSLLITPLKENKVYRLKLNNDGSIITGDTISYFRGDGNRIRRVISDPTGLKFYVLRDNNTLMEYTYTGVTLPVTLMSFNGYLQNNSVLLQWKTSREINTSKFVIERSADGSAYQAIGTVAAAGSSAATIDYSYTDNTITNQSASVFYYRLKMIDIDGSSKFSNIVAITRWDKAAKLIVSPNPTFGTAKVTIASPVGSNAQWRLTDNNGRIVQQNSIQLAAGSNDLMLNLNRLPAGVYYLNVSGTGIDQKTKLQKL